MVANLEKIPSICLPTHFFTSGSKRFFLYFVYVFRNSFPKDNTVSRNLFFMSGNGQLSITLSRLKKRLSLYLLSATPFPSHWCKQWWSQLELGDFVLGFLTSPVSCDLLVWRATGKKFWKQGGGIGLGSTPFIASAIPCDVYEYKSS